MKQDVLSQSKNAYGQWCKQWRTQATYHSKYAPFRDLKDFKNIGVGRALVLAANGYSLEANLEDLKKYRSQCHIMACDKSLGHLIEAGIKPDYCMVCDANVPYSYLEPYKDQLDRTDLIMNVCANPEWSDNGNWQRKFFFANMDVLRSEKEFMGLSGCQNKIPAATNVSNAMLVFATQCDNERRNNFMGYDKLILLGYDYCWGIDTGYYCNNWDGSGKRYYMKHLVAIDRHGDRVYTSGNLLFSAQWLEKYIRNFNLPVVNCSKPSLLGVTPYKGLKSQLDYSYKIGDGKRVNDLMNEVNLLGLKIKARSKELKEISQDHWYNFIGSI